MTSTPWATPDRRPGTWLWALLGDTATRILYYEPHEEASAAGKLLGLSAVEVHELGRLADGEGLWRVNDRAFIVRHLRTPDEAALFNTDARMLAKDNGLPGPVRDGTVPV